MAKQSKTRGPGDNVLVKGFFRLRIMEDGKVVGDTDWKENQIVNLGFDQYLCQSLAGMAGSKTVSYALIGTGTAPGATATSLDGEITDIAGMRMAVTPTTIASKTVQFAFTLASNKITAAKTIQNIGLINHSSTATAATIFAGGTYATSSLSTAQSLEGSYQIRFA